MLILTPLYADVIMIKWRKTANATLLPCEVCIISFQNFDSLEMCIPFPYDQELSPDREHIHLVALVFSSTSPCYERVIRRYFDLFDFPIGQQHQGHHVLFKARGEHFQIIHDLNMPKHFH